MRAALRLADAAARAGEAPIGAVVAVGGCFLTGAHNQREAACDPTGHAETLAIRRAASLLRRWRLEECTLYVTLEPCLMCAGAIVQARVGRVVYGAADAKAGAVESLYRVFDDERLNWRPSWRGGVLAEECSRALKDFFADLRRRRAAPR